MNPTLRIPVGMTLTLSGHTYRLDTLTGIERLNKPYSYTFTLKARELVDSTTTLGKPAYLTLRLENNPRARFISGIILKHEVLTPYTAETVRIQLTLGPKLNLLELAGSPRVYRYQTARSIVQTLLHRHGYGAHQLAFHDAWQDKPIQYPLWVQAEGEDDLAFMHRVLARDGISYLWKTTETPDEQLLFLDDCLLHPTHNETLFYVSPDQAIREADWRAMYQVSRHHTFATYRVTCRDRDLYDATNVWEAVAGNGARPVMLWGHGAQSIAHLERIARFRHEQLMMEALVYSALTFHPFLATGHLMAITPSMYWEGTHFLLTEIVHHVDAGGYYNTIKCLPKGTPVRPEPCPRQAGQLIHTAVIYSHDDLPYLDDKGQYTYRLHLHWDSGDDLHPTQLQKAPRLSPYGGVALDKAMGMHFPLKRQAEVLVMYLHHDFNQPILQNSPADGLNEAPIVRDSSWSFLLKTAYGQFLGFCDKTAEQHITLANAKHKNRLVLQAHENDHHVHLRADNGSLRLIANGHQSLASEDDIETHVAGKTTWEATEDMLLYGNTVHFQSKTMDVNAQKGLSAEADGHIEWLADTMSMESEGDITLTAQGACLQFHLPNGDSFIEADDITIESQNDMVFSTPGASLHFKDGDIAFHAKRIHIGAASLTFAAPIHYQSTPSPQPSPVFIPPPAALIPVPYFPNRRAQTVASPDWEKPFFAPGEKAYVHVPISGFEGHEAVEMTVVRWASPCEVHPRLRDLVTAQTVSKTTYQLGDKTLYLSDNEEPGNATLRLPITLPHTDATLEAPFYARLQVGDVVSEVYSNPMIILTDINLHLDTDKAYPFQDRAATVTLHRALPAALQSHPNAPPSDEPRFIAPTLTFQHVPTGTFSDIHWKEKGVWQELLKEDFTLPLPKQTLSLAADKPNEATFHRLMPPMLVDVRSARVLGDDIVFDKPNAYTRNQLSDDEVAYLKANGNNLTVFIHGFNVEWGEFSKHVEAVDYVEHTGIQTAGLTPMVTKTLVLEQRLSEADATIWRDSAFMSTQFPDHKKAFEELGPYEENHNGSGVYEWVIHLERQLNVAAGFDGIHYAPFTRCLFIAWDGAPLHAVDYMVAAKHSIAKGPVVAKLLRNIQQQVPGLTLNVIAHSQGNGILLHALDNLIKAGGQPIDHAFFWQAAIPYDALSSHQADKTPQKDDPWYCPNAHLASKQFTILYSKNDNILGPLLHKNEQPAGVQLYDVWARKNKIELISALLLNALDAESLYIIANWIGSPITDLLHEDTLNIAWDCWRKHHPTCQVRGRTFTTQPTLETQYWLLRREESFLSLDSQFLFLSEDSITKRLIDMQRRLYTFIQECYNKQPLQRFTYEFGSLILPALAEVVLTSILVGNKIGETIDYVIHLGKLELTNSQSTIRSLTAFAKTVFLHTRVKERPAMGYEGIDDLDDLVIKQMIKEKKINREDTTRWIWFHSDMKIASKDIIENVYKERILKHAKVFGKYDVKHIT